MSSNSWLWIPQIHMLFAVSDGDDINRLISCFFLALPFFFLGASNNKFLNYLNKHIIPIFDKVIL
ncbi:unnamed protein product, partial [Vitis vinifera]|uniref:Uncharacterized protein n=1 Tax=Vitis vinifera TaxID=29760 RepID=D7TU86_VITVI